MMKCRGEKKRTYKKGGWNAKIFFLLIIKQINHIFF